MKNPEMQKNKKTELEIKSFSVCSSLILSLPLCLRSSSVSRLYAFVVNVFMSVCTLEIDERKKHKKLFFLSLLFLFLFLSPPLSLKSLSFPPFPPYLTLSTLHTPSRARSPSTTPLQLPATRRCRRTKAAARAGTISPGARTRRQSTAALSRCRRW